MSTYIMVLKSMCVVEHILTIAEKNTTADNVFYNKN